MSSGTPLGKMVIELGLDSTDFGKGLDGAKKMTNYAMKEMQANMKVYDLAGDKLGKFQAQQTGLSKVIDSQRQKVDALKKSYEGSFVDGKPTAQTAKFATQLQQANGQLAAYQKQLANSAGEMAKWQIENTGVTGALNTFGSKLTSVGGVASKFGDNLTAKVTTPIVGMVAASVKAAMDWESAFAGVKKTNDEVVDSTGKVVYSYKDLENGLRSMAKELPASHQEIAATAEAAGQLGIQTKNVTGFTKTMIDLGESTNMSAEEAATALARLANITGMPQTEFDKLGSVIVDLGNNFATTESEITAMGLRLAGAGKQVGMTEAQIMSFAAALSSVGIEAEAGGSAFSKIMVEMQLAVETGQGAFDDLIRTAERNGIAWEAVSAAYNKGGKELKNMSNAMGLGDKGLKDIYKSAEDAEGKLNDFANVAGLSTDEFANAFKQDASGAITQFIKGLGEMESRGSTAIKTLDGMGITEVRLRDALLRASGASDVFTDAINMGSKAWDENTALTEEAEKRYETTESQLKMLKNEVIDVGIEFGGPFLKALRDGVQAAKPLIQTVTDLSKRFSEASPETQKMVMKTIAYTAAAGPMLSIVGRLTSGLGGLTTKSIGFIGVLAKKKTIAEFTTQLVSGSADLVKWGNTATTGAAATAKFGTAASAAAGANGVGAVTGALGALGPVALGIVGAGGVLAVGYAAWKLWGEEVYNAGERTKRWGSDVGEVTDKSLTEIKGYSQGAVGELGLMEQGVATSTESIVNNFTKMGESIETKVTNKITGLKDLLEGLPDSVEAAAAEVVNDEIKAAEEVKNIVEKNNAEITNIKKNAADQNRQVTYEETIMIKQLMQNSAQEYLNITIDNADARKKILDAMTGDVKSATKEQATDWIKSLGEQRAATEQNWNEQLSTQKKKLEAMGYSLESDFAKKYLSIFEQSKEDSLKVVDDQMGVILSKYPEIAEQINLHNGKMLTGIGDYNQALVAANKSMAESLKDSSKTIADNAEENAQKIDLQSDAFGQAADKWNSLVFDYKEGKVKTNAKEEIFKATQSQSEWAKLAYGAKDANLKTNAKLVLAEAALANGHWSTLEFMGKEALIESNATRTIIDAMEKEGLWNELSFEQKKAILYSDTPEKVAEAIDDMGLWNKMGWRVHMLKADNYDYLNKINMSEEYLEKWNELSPDVKSIMLDNTEYSFKILESEETYRRFSSLPESEKKLLANNEQLLTTVLDSENMYRRWSQLPSDTKQMLANNTDLLDKVFGSEAAYSKWLKLPERDKNILGNNADLLSKVFSSEESYKKWLELPVEEKRILADNSDLDNKIGTATTTINIYNEIETPTKMLNSSTNALDAKGFLDGLISSWGSIPKYEEKQQVVRQNFIGPQLPNNARGTNYHPGGGMIVNDQKGSLYREFVQYPNGYGFIPEGRDVIIPDAPRGTKVLPARKTKEMFPQYAKGIGLFKDSKLMQSINQMSEKIEITIENKQNKGSVIDEKRLVTTLVDLLKQSGLIAAGKKTTGQPLQLNINLGPRELQAFVQDISELQGKEIDIQGNF